MKKITLAVAVSLMAGCSAAELNQSLAAVTGQNIGVIRTYPSNKFTAFSGNTVYSYSNTTKPGSTCEIFFEVNNQNTIVLTSYKGEACNSFYNDTLKPKS